MSDPDYTVKIEFEMDEDDLDEILYEAEQLALEMIERVGQRVEDDVLDIEELEENLKKFFEDYNVPEDFIDQITQLIDRGFNEFDVQQKNFLEEMKTAMGDLWDSELEKYKTQLENLIQSPDIEPVREIQQGLTNTVDQTMDRFNRIEEQINIMNDIVRKLTSEFPSLFQKRYVPEGGTKYSKRITGLEALNEQMQKLVNNFRDIGRFTDNAKERGINIDNPRHPTPQDNSVNTSTTIIPTSSPPSLTHLTTMIDDRLSKLTDMITNIKIPDFPKSTATPQLALVERLDQINDNILRLSGGESKEFIDIRNTMINQPPQPDVSNRQVLNAINGLRSLIKNIEVYQE